MDLRANPLGDGLAAVRRVRLVGQCPLITLGHSDFSHPHPSLPPPRGRVKQGGLTPLAAPCSLEPEARPPARGAPHPAPPGPKAVRPRCRHLLPVHPTSLHSPLPT